MENAVIEREIGNGEILSMVLVRGESEDTVPKSLIDASFLAAVMLAKNKMLGSKTIPEHQGKGFLKVSDKAKGGALIGVITVEFQAN